MIIFITKLDLLFVILDIFKKKHLGVKISSWILKKQNTDSTDASKYDLRLLHVDNNCMSWFSLTYIYTE